MDLRRQEAMYSHVAPSHPMSVAGDHGVLVPHILIIINQLLPLKPWFHIGSVSIYLSIYLSNLI